MLLNKTFISAKISFKFYYAIGKKNFLRETMVDFCNLNDNY